MHRTAGRRRRALVSGPSHLAAGRSVISLTDIIGFTEMVWGLGDPANPSAQADM